MGSPDVLPVRSRYGSARDVAQAELGALRATPEAASAGRWSQAEAATLQLAARTSAASTRAVAARALVVRTFAQQVRHLHVPIAELQAAIPALLEADADGQRLQQLPGIGPNGAATIRAE